MRTELQLFVAMLERAGIGHGQRDDYEQGWAVQVELLDDAIADFLFDVVGNLKQVVFKGDDTA